jgi:DNA polymerase, archaea type
LIVHGVALRSSRSEPFGERFLRQALLCTMTNDIIGVRDAYFEMVSALRNRSLPASDLGARVRLSKTPEAYLANRAGHSEPQYEALLAAGRTRWYPGERVRFYRTRGKKFIWLPEEADEATVGRDEDTDTDVIEPEHNLLLSEEQQANRTASRHKAIGDRRDYDVEHYLQVLVTSYASRLRKAFTPTDFEQLFRLDAQPGLFDRPVENIQPRWIRCG